jgi:hypothetical protein
MKKRQTEVRACQRCGCTAKVACPRGCAWMPNLVDVCTACATEAELLQAFDVLRRKVARG